jgi:hypothetical protein
MEWVLLYLCLCTLLFVVAPVSTIIFLVPVGFFLKGLLMLLYSVSLLSYWILFPFFERFLLRFWIGQRAFKHNPLVQRVFYDYFSFVADDPHNVLERQQGKPTLFAVHPHGVYAVALIGYFGFNPSPQMAGCTVAVSSLLFRLPVVREIMYLIGACSVKRGDMARALAPSRALIGKACWLAMCPGKRKGFIKIAKEAGADIVLVTCADELKLYRVVPLSLPWSLRDWFLRHFLYPFPVFCWGNPWLPFWPKKLSEGMTLSFGPPVSTTDKSVDEIFNTLYREFICYIPSIFFFAVFCLGELERGKQHGGAINRRGPQILPC